MIALRGKRWKGLHQLTFFSSFVMRRYIVVDKKKSTTVLAQKVLITFQPQRIGRQNKSSLPPEKLPFSLLAPMHIKVTRTQRLEGNEAFRLCACQPPTAGHAREKADGLLTSCQ
ncbi:hypothetical protein DUNSADRAFT_16390 [Dunaliella salina]|uniref:Encoded protein n=1 Tax=Dunaliella salina TaxID=3046 RepID=A0ABQ7G3T0_DUNSA|nr:hypothetical protein DUNSADRAFT_16390 [Dunaliella salina]|eukprot:KAF5829232.1 hypothetical protein DUNSADRAFT_16390 [Dunaliella salina]